MKPERTVTCSLSRARTGAKIADIGRLSEKSLSMDKQISEKRKCPEFVMRKCYE